MNSKIVDKSHIWDMHIHTCDCPKGSSEFCKLNKKEFISQFIEISKRYPNFNLFSFTDHNQVSIDVYNEYLEQEGPLNFLVGIEIDTYFNPANPKDFKHVICYFDIDNSTFKENIQFFEELNQKINKSPISIQDLLDFLVSHSIKFVLSPHAFKQDKRGIEHYWTDQDAVEQNAHKYMDQFFSFWETSGFSEIAKAIKFLDDFNLDKRVSIISFSDSNNFKKFENYLKNPPQYFDSLPTFSGLLMVGTEISRISNKMHEVKSNEFGNLIGKVVFNNQTIEFSNKLNCVIGGRGSGKSLLLDSIARNLNSKIKLSKDRGKFIDKLNIKIYNYSGTEIKKDNFNFDYFEQSYVSKIFSSNDYSENIKDYFKDEFAKLKSTFDALKIENDNFLNFSTGLSTFEDNKLENLSDIVNRYQIVHDNYFLNSLDKKDKVETNSINYTFIDSIESSFTKFIPEPIFNDDEVNLQIKTLLKLLVNKSYQYNLSLINTDLIKNSMIDEYFEYRSGISKVSKDKELIEKLFNDTFVEKGKDVIKRVNIINNYIRMEKTFVNHYEDEGSFDGEFEKAFKITNSLDIETPYEYLQRVFEEYMPKKVIVDDNKEFNLEKAVEYYCYVKEKNLKSDKKITDLDLALQQFDLKYNEHPEIYYLVNGQYENIRNLSPGTQTNILMEYIVNKQTNLPLLIDQPEDNVDNYTIYNKLRIWFKTMKTKRQVIVVTHDANIVINSDAENLIHVNHPKKDVFDYTYGALEYSDNLITASKILDGGTEAIKRRIMKYGE